MNPSGKLNPLLHQLSHVVADSTDLESLVRPLLELLEMVTGLEATYLTVIDENNNLQKVLFSRNKEPLLVPEGLNVPWCDSLCKYALDGGIRFTTEVPDLWPDQQLGIQTYVTEPVRIEQGRLYGTLCGASRSRIQINPEQQQLLMMFAALCARQIERENLLARLQKENLQYQHFAFYDTLTGVPNRRILEAELTLALQKKSEKACPLHLAFIDLDGFKTLNDTHGHDTGDAFLVAFANRIMSCLKEGEFMARYGGDEFIVFGWGDPDLPPDVSALELQDRLNQASRGQFELENLLLDYPGASIGLVTASDSYTSANQLIAEADAAMYQVKTARKSNPR